MTFEESLYKFLSTNSDITALVGTRTYPVILQQGSILPALVYQEISAIHSHFFGGDSGHCSKIFQISIYGTTYSSVKTVAATLKKVLRNYSGTLGTGGINIQAVLVQSELDDYDDQAKEFFVKQDYEFIFEEAV